MIIGRRLRFRPLKMECPGALQRVNELMPLSHRCTIVAIMFYRNARELSDLQLWNSLRRIAKVQRDTDDDVDAVQLQRDLRSLLRRGVPLVIFPTTWSA